VAEQFDERFPQGQGAARAAVRAPTHHHVHDSKRS
jgi:hypothetical protein